MARSQGTDVWFRTRLSLAQVAAVLGARVVTEDVEDTWAWLIAEYDGLVIDITRDHTVPAAETDTRIFRYDADPGVDPTFPARTSGRIVAALHRAGVGAVHVGSWVRRPGDDRVN